MLFSRASLVLALTTVVAAAPLERKWSTGGYWWTPTSTSSYIDFGRRGPQPDSNAPPSCDLAKASMPAAPTPLPPPAAGLTLAHVAIGRGVQNYTCDLSNATAVPTPIGALATLFNVTCLAADEPALVSKLPPIALDLPLPLLDDPESPAYQDMSGHHYFIDLTTAFFNMDTALHQWGSGAFKKVNASNAALDAPLGQNGVGHGAVAWLKLDAADPASGQIYREVYRLNTAGGNPPPTCQGQAAAFSVQYSAEYWLFE